MTTTNNSNSGLMEKYAEIISLEPPQPTPIDGDNNPTGGRVMAAPHAADDTFLSNEPIAKIAIDSRVYQWLHVIYPIKRPIIKVISKPNQKTFKSVLTFEAVNADGLFVTISIWDDSFALITNLFNDYFRYYV